MCGIIGFRKSFAEALGGEYDFLKSIRFRGPDAEGIADCEEYFFGHTRLSILDLEAGIQPMERDGSWICFNGEIYNHEVIRKELLAEGVNFKTKSDTEVILVGYLKHGVTFFERLNGMFAFGIWDRRDKSLILARDFFGIKPLYFSQEWGFIFASNATSILTVLRDSGNDLKINPKALEGYLEKKFVNPDQLFDEKICELPKGECWVVKDGVVTRKERINPPSLESGLSDTDMLKRQINLELEADVPVGVLLSGGVDSSVVSALASESKSISTFSLVFDEADVDESIYSDQVSSMLKTKHRRIMVHESDLLERMRDMIDVIDLPISDPAMLPLLHLMKEVKKDVKVVLSGDGGDELYAGYTHHRILKYKGLFKLLAFLLTPFEKIEKISNAMRVVKSTMRRFDSMEKAVDYDLNIGLNQVLLRKSDLCSMYYGIEMRVPFLNRMLYEKKRKSLEKESNVFANKLTLRWFLFKRFNWRIAFKKKQGFRVPLHKWVTQGELSQRIDIDLNSAHPLLEDAFDLARYLKNPNTYYRELFDLYVLDQWLKKNRI